MLFVDEFCGIYIYIKFGADVTSQYVGHGGKNKKTIAEYIRNQWQEDLAYEQISIKELLDPFTGESVRSSKKWPTSLVVA